MSTSTSLLEALRAGRQEAWTRFVALYSPVVYGWVRQQGLQPTDAADVLQEVFTAVVRRLPQFRRDRAGDSLRGWMWTITRNKTLDWFRARNRQPQALGGSTAQHELANLPADSDESAAVPLELPVHPGVALRALEAIRGEFADRTWQAFRLTVLEGQTARQAAEELRISTNAVRLAKSRVLKRLREECGEP